MAVARAAVVVVALLGAGVCSGCPSQAGDARDLAVSSDARARVVVDEALAALRGGRLDEVLGRFCDQGEGGLARARAVLTPAVGRGDVVIRRVEPAWVGAEPFFYVEVGSPDGAFEHGLGVQVKTGCLERAVGAPEAAAETPDDDATPVDAGAAVAADTVNAADAGSAP
jgi:hypothetical protein